MEPHATAALVQPRAVLDFDMRLQLPNHALFVGASMSGKTRLATHLLTHPEVFADPPRTILLYYDQPQPAYAEAKRRLAVESGIDLQLRRGSSVCLDSLPSFQHPAVLFIDDASEATASSDEIARIATNGRHKNISLWLVWHSLYSRHPASRIIAQNVSLFFFLPSLRLESQMRTFGCQLGMRDALLSAYHQCVEEAATAAAADPDDTREVVAPVAPSHRYLLVDLGPRTPKTLRLRTNVHLPRQFAFCS